jgi:porphobilinogen synthase
MRWHQCSFLFPELPDNVKDPIATESINSDGPYQTAIRALKREVPDLVVMIDVAMDPYSSDGDDGFVDKTSGKSSMFCSRSLAK